MGWAVLEGRELVEWGVLGFRQRDPEKLLHQVHYRLTEHLRRYQPILLALERPANPRLQTSPLLRAITNQIRTVAEREEIPVRGYDLETVRRRLCGMRRATQGQVADSLVAQYPDLRPYREARSPWQVAYWRSMFVAVGVGVVCAEERASLATALRSAEPIPHEEGRG